MPKRLLTLRQIQAEKFPRSRSLIFDALRNGGVHVGERVVPFPKPIGGCVPHLWEEEAIDTFLENFVAAAKATESKTGGARKAAAAKAMAARAAA